MKTEEVLEGTAPVETAITEGSGEENPGMLYAATHQTPWWIVSVLLHALVIVLAGLMTMQINLGDEPELVMQVTDVIPPQTKMMEEKKSDPMSKLVDKETPAVTTQHQSEENIMFTEALMQMAEISEVDTTYNPDRPDTNSALGTPDAFVRLTVSGSTDPAGGGGSNGATVLMDSMVGFGAASSGVGSNWGGGEGHGIGPGKGNSFGERGIPEGGSNKFRMRKPKPGMDGPSQSALHAALRWLAYNQEADGHWDAKKYGASVKTDTAVTGFALLAFLGAGHSEKVGEYKDNVRRAVAWLKSKQDADGMLWDTSDDNAGHRARGYPCAIATLAMVEAGGMGNVPDTRKAAQKAVDYVCNVHQFGEGYDKRGWRYAPKSEGDLSVTGWYIMALKSAKVCGFSVPEHSMQGAIAFLDSVETKEQPLADVYGVPSRYKYMTNNDHIHTAHRLTAIGTLARQFLGWKADELQATAAWFVQKGGVPEYGANGEKVDLYYWYYASLACYQQSKVQPQLWKQWCDALKKSVIDNQCQNGDDRGSWNPVGDYSGEWGRVGQTALNALCMEVWYRYDIMDHGTN